MIVYGDPSYEIEFSVLVAQLQARADSACAMVRAWKCGTAAGAEALDVLRSLLIFAGQVEQAVQDAAPEASSYDSAQFWCQRCEAWTDAAAAAFAAVLSRIESIPTNASSASAGRGSTGTAPYAHFPDGDLQSLEAWEPLLTDSFQSLASETPASRVNVKLPEGFAFYALYPERYVASARCWAAASKSNIALDADAAVLLVGMRSIGTSLSALVKVDLQAQGRGVTRCTIRPIGRPYARRVEPADEQSIREMTKTIGVTEALIMDEGPGMSGSSMASAAQALADAGIERSRIAFLPGHGGEPGGQGDETTQCWWATTPRYATPLEAVRWNGLALPDALAARTVGLYAGGMSVVKVETCGGGIWRSTAYASELGWPAACAAFERPKYLCTLENGDRLLWKFAGLATEANGEAQEEAVFDALTERSKLGWTVAPLGRGMGFVALPWLAGTLLTRADADIDTLNHIARYLVAVSAPPMAEQEAEAAIARLFDMLYWNTWEALGEETAARTRRWSETAVTSDWIKRARTYGDGHLASHEWLRTQTGNLLKTDSDDHSGDHTIVGKQCYVWDVAGAVVEWGLDPDSIRRFTDAVQQAAGETIPDNALTFYRMAYAAYRIGQTSLCAQISGHDPKEQSRLWRAYDLYKTALLAALQTD